MQILKAEVGHGEIRQDGSLGFGASMTGDRVMMPPRVRFDRAISAHAPSEVVVELDRPGVIRGALNASACLHDGGCCEFRVDDHWIGDLSAPCETTPALRLPAGSYRLRSRTTRRSWGAHSLWLIDDDNSAMAGRVALVTVVCYPADRVKETARWLFASAAKVGWLVHAFGVGEPPLNYFDCKIRRLAGWIKALPACYESVVFLDARDTIVHATEAEVAARLAHPLLISMEGPAWPERGERWTSEFRSIVAENEEPTGLDFINSGMYGGRRDAVVRFLEGLARLRGDWMTGSGPAWLAPYRHFNDDQFLFQARYRLDPCSIRLDTRSSLFCNMSWHHVELAHPDIHPGDGKVTTRYGTEPLFLHFNGPLTPNMVHWYHWLLG